MLLHRYVIQNVWVVSILEQDSALEHLANDFLFIALKTRDLGIVANSNGIENFDIQYYSFDHLIS